MEWNGGNGMIAEERMQGMQEGKEERKKNDCHFCFFLSFSSESMCDQHCGGSENENEHARTAV